MKKNITPVIALFVICAAVTALVACVNSLTADTIADNAEKQAQETMKALIPDAAEFQAGQSSADETYLAYGSDGNLLGCIFVTTGTGGYGGDITVMTATDPNGVVTGLEITEDEETQGLGKNAHNESFRSQYVGKNTDKYTVTKSAPSAENEIQALTGATKTSKAVTEAVNRAKAAAKEIGEGGDHNA